MAENITEDLSTDIDAFFSSVLTYDQDVSGSLYIETDRLFFSRIPSQRSSDIVVTSLTAIPTMRGNKLVVTINDPRSGAIPGIAINTVIFYASTTDSFVTAIEVCRGYPEAQHAGLAEERTYYYWAKAINNSGSFGVVYPTSPDAGVPCTSIGISGLVLGLANANLTASVASNNLTVAMKTALNNDPSSNDPIFVAFRSVSASTGSYVIQQITSALSLTYNGGSRFPPYATGVAFRLWVLLIDDGGTIRLALTSRSQSGEVSCIEQSGIVSTASDPTAQPDASVGHVVTPGVTVTSKAYRIVGYLEWTTGLNNSSANFDIGPDIIRLFGSDVPLPGSVLQSRTNNIFTATALGTTLTPFDDTIPQRGEGDTAINLAITPRSPVSILTHDVILHLATSSGVNPIVASIHYQTGFGSADSLASVVSTPPAANMIVPLIISFFHQALVGTEIGFQVNAGGTVAGTVTLNGVSSARKLGGVLCSSYRIMEIQG